MAEVETAKNNPSLPTGPGQIQHIFRQRLGTTQLGPWPRCDQRQCTPEDATQV